MSKDSNDKKMNFSYKLGNSKNLYGKYSDNFHKYQNYLPLYEKFFLLKEDNYDKITLNSEYSIKNIDSEINNNTYFCLITKNNNSDCDESDEVDDFIAPVFFKYSPLIDPIKYIGGEEKMVSLPDFKTKGDSNNIPYIDGLFYFLSSKLLETHNFINGNRFYGQHLTYKKELEVDISDDLEYLLNREHFNKNKEKFKVSEEFYSCVETFVSNKNKRRLQINNNQTELINIDCDDIENYNNLSEINDVFISCSNNNTSGSSLLYESKVFNNKSNKSSKSSKSSNQSQKSSSSYDSNSEDDNDSDDNDDNDNKNCSSDDEYEDISSEEDSDTESMEQTPKIAACLENMPINMIGLECYVDTLDTYISECDIETDEMTCILLQIIFTLIGYQQAFSFVHNDLHTNNVMYIPTDNDYIFYKYENKYYKVKTYGKLWKIIDYGRGTYVFNDKIMFSSSFNFNGDAATQYNCEPYYNPKKKRVDVNFSFDLCRLGCSLYEDLFGDEVIQRSELSPIEHVIVDWCLDYKGRNVLIKNNGEERYEDFKLYKMIARTVHHHTPKAQLGRDIFKKYISKNTKSKKNITTVDIDSIPDYTKTQEHW